MNEEKILKFEVKQKPDYKFLVEGLNEISNIWGTAETLTDAHLLMQRTLKVRPDLYKDKLGIEVSHSFLTDVSGFSVGNGAKLKGYLPKFLSCLIFDNYEEQPDKLPKIKDLRFRVVSSKSFPFWCDVVNTPFNVTGLGAVGNTVGDMYKMLIRQISNFYPFEDLGTPDVIVFEYPNEEIKGDFRLFVNEGILELNEEPNPFAGIKDKILLECIHQVLNEYDNAKEKHPVWPTDLIHRASIIAEETGELLRGANLCVLESEKNTDLIYKEAIQVAATALRFLREFRKM